MNVELETAEALLDIGVSVPLKIIRIPFTRRGWTLRLTMKRPCLGSQIRIARIFHKMGTSYEKMKAFTKEEEMEFLARNGGKLCKMISLMICRGFFSGWILSPLVAFLVRWFVPDVFILGANIRYVSLLGTQHFTNTIRFIEMRNPLRPNLSQKKRGS